MTNKQYFNPGTKDGLMTIEYTKWLAKTTEMPSPATPVGSDEYWLFYPKEGHPYSVNAQELYEIWLNEEMNLVLQKEG